jgi:hypothetical protein
MTELTLSFSGIFKEDRNNFVVGATTNNVMTCKCHQVQVKFRASDQGDAKTSQVELAIYLIDEWGRASAFGHKWSKPFLSQEWIEVDTIFDDQDDIVQYARPGCKYEVWYKVGDVEVVEDFISQRVRKHILCVDYFSLTTSAGPSSVAASASHIEYEQLTYRASGM